MKRTVVASLALSSILAITAFAGALILEIGSPDTNPEARALNALIVARVTACHEPAKSTVTASLLQLDGGQLRSTPIKVEPLKAPGTFAIIGQVPGRGIVDLAVTNPEYQNYRPRVLIRTGGHGLELASMRRYYSTPPTHTEISSMLRAVD